MAMRLLFGALACGLLVVAYAAWNGGQVIPALGALAIAGWLAWMALAGLARRR